MPRDATEISEAGADGCCRRNLNSQTLAHALKVLPQLAFLSRGLGPKPSAAIAHRFIRGIHESRASEGALKKVPLLGAAAAPLSPY